MTESEVQPPGGQRFPLGHLLEFQPAPLLRVGTPRLWKPVALFASPHAAHVVVLLTRISLYLQMGSTALSLCVSVLPTSPLLCLLSQISPLWRHQLAVLTDKRQLVA